MAAIMVVCELPPRQSLSSHVRTESRNGMCSSLRFLRGSAVALAAARAAMTFPSAAGDARGEASQRGTDGGEGGRRRGRNS